MQNLNTLFKRNANGSINQWTIFIDNNFYWVEFGQVGGIIQKGELVECFPKNVGRSNATTANEQAYLEALSIWKNKKKSNNCVENIEDVDKLLFQPPMLAQVYDKKYTEDMKFIQPKFDGVRMNISFNGKEIAALSRKNNPFYTVEHIKQSLEKILVEHPSLHIDGELYNHELHNDFNKIVSLVKKEKISDEQRQEIVSLVRYTVYDIWDDDNPNMLFSERNTLINELLNDIEYIDIAPTYEIHNQEEIDLYFRQFISEGYEGAIIRKNAKYEHKRSKNLLKYKEFDDDEFEVLDVCEGKKQGQAEYCWINLRNGNTCKATLSFNNDECKEILENKDKYIGKFATVRFFGWTNDGSLRFPVLKAFRNYE